MIAIQYLIPSFLTSSTSTRHHPLHSVSTSTSADHHHHQHGDKLLDNNSATPLSSISTASVSLSQLPEASSDTSTAAASESSSSSSSVTASSSSSCIGKMSRNNNSLVFLFGLIFFIKLTVCNIQWSRYNMDRFNLTSYYPATVHNLSMLSALKDPNADRKARINEYMIRKMRNETIDVYINDKTMAIVDYGMEGNVVDCELFDLEKRNESAQEKAGSTNRPTQIISLKAMNSIIMQCQDLAINSLTEADNDTSAPVNKWPINGIVPGTKWCGLGDSAQNYDELGPKARVDICCRAHDHCPLRLGAFRNDYGLQNMGIYTKSYCSCDEEFFKCLTSAKSQVAEHIITIYFKISKIQCIREDPTPYCIKRNNKQECITFNKNSTKYKFDNPNIQMRVN